MVLAVDIANALRALAVTEIFFTIGWLVARVWKRRHHPWQYLSLMAVALVIYSFFAAGVMITRWNDRLSWFAPVVLFAATVSFVAVLREGHHQHNSEIEGTKGGGTVNN